MKNPCTTERYWVCRGSWDGCGQKHATHEDAKTCCDRNDVLVDRECEDALNPRAAEVYRNRYVRHPVCMEG